LVDGGINKGVVQEWQGVDKGEINKGETDAVVEPLKVADEEIFLFISTNAN